MFLIHSPVFGLDIGVLYSTNQVIKLGLTTAVNAGNFIFGMPGVQKCETIVL